MPTRFHRPAPSRCVASLIAAVLIAACTPEPTPPFISDMSTLDTEDTNGRTTDPGLKDSDTPSDPHVQETDSSSETATDDTGFPADTDSASYISTDGTETTLPTDADTETDTTTTGTDTASDTDTAPTGSPTLLVAPLIHATTADGFTINAVTASGDPELLRLFVLGADGWEEVLDRSRPGDDIVEWRVSGRAPGTVYPYAIVSEAAAVAALDGVVPHPRDAEIPFDAWQGDGGVSDGDMDAGPVAPADGGISDDAGDRADSDTTSDTTPITPEIDDPRVLFLGEVVTQRPPSTRFSFALMTDSHLRPHEVTPDLDIWRIEEETFLAVVDDINQYLPDFVVHLGDVLDFHDYGFNDPSPSSEVTRLGYLNYRRLFGDTMGNLSHFMVIGNWEGENGNYTEDQIARSLSQRLLYAPGPTPGTYPESGSENEDYYAFTWGDALFIVLNVMTYTPDPHLLSQYPGEVDDWTLGDAQFVWFVETLINATAKWRFVLIHHTVGGQAGDFPNSAYGRGGGQAAYVGEQALIQNLMKTYGVQIFFYGHDHVFTDMVVDNIHYTLPGSCGATWKFASFETGYTDYRPESGYGMVTVTPDDVRVSFVAMGGEILKQFVVE